MTRLESMEKYLKPFIYQRIRKKITSIRTYTDGSIPKVFDEFFLKAIEIQKKSSWIPEYLAVFHLQSSLVTGSNNCLLCLMNEQMYLDKERIEYDWYPEFLYDNLDKEKSLISEALRKNYVRVKDFEIDYMILQLFTEYNKIIQVYLVKNFNQWSSISSFLMLKKKEPFSILYGEYMGEISKIMTCEGRNHYV